ncbi:MAG: efflux RND transporter periplasmic adaptor subunit [Verrucomicrobiae bacterium]|nr:efflux RND transporter periplasmic adaptor subunit [Verrucomicrobiae bacterium]
MNPSRPRRKRKWLTFLIWFFILGGLGGGAWWYFKGQTRTEPEYFTSEVKKGDLEESVTASGTLQPTEFVDVGVQVSGILQKIFVKMGDRVQKGQLLAEIDPTVLAARVEQDTANLKNLRAQLDSRQASLTLARQKLDRNRRLIELDAVSQETLQQTESELLKAQADIEALKAQIESAEGTIRASQANLSYTKIYAPMDGTVVNLFAKEGQTLNANQTTPNLIRLAVLEMMTVNAKVSEADIQKITPGMRAYFTTLGDSEKRYYGNVSRVDPTPESTNAPIFYSTLFEVKNEAGSLKPTMTAQVYFLLSESKDVLLMPGAALDFFEKTKALDGPSKKGGKEGDKDSRKVYVLKNGELVEKSIKVGRKNRASIEIVSGLSEKDEVVVGPMPQPPAQGQPANTTRNRPKRFK